MTTALDVAATVLPPWGGGLIGNQILPEHPEWAHLAEPWQPPETWLACVTADAHEALTVTAVMDEPLIGAEPDADGEQQRVAADQLRRWGADPDDTSELTRIMDVL